MASPVEVLKRNRYFIAGAPDLPHSSRNHVDDWHEHHLPLARMHQAHLHDWGIASGLEVSVTPEGQQLEVQPGVAVDSTGELIALSAGGQADISVLAPGEPERQIAAPFRLGTEGHAGQLRYLTIQFAETLRLTQGVGGKLEQTPWLRLQPTAGDGAYVDDGSSIILAVAQIDDTGVATVQEQQTAIPHARHLMGSVTAELRIRRAATTAGQVGQGLAATLSAEPGGGLRVTVPEGDQVVVRAETLRVGGALEVVRDITVAGTVDGRDVSADGQKLDSHVGITSGNPHGTTAAQIGALPLTGGTLTGNLTVSGVVKLQQGTAINEFSSDGKLAGNSEAAVPTERAVKEYIDNLLVGCVAAFATTTPPPGWFECNGQAISRAQHARLFAQISTTFGPGDGSTTFNVPDLRGVVIRGWDHGSGQDSGRNFGSYQGDAFQDHQHSFSGISASISGGSHSHVNFNNGFFRHIKLSGGGTSEIVRFGDGSTHPASHAHAYTPSGSVSLATTGNKASETRIKNRALMYCIKS